MSAFTTVPNAPWASGALLTDLYELTMAYGYWKSGTAAKEAVFHLFFRTPPFQSGFTIACGLTAAIDWLRDFRFDESDLAYHYSDFLSDFHFFNSLIRRFRWDW